MRREPEKDRLQIHTKSHFQGCIVIVRYHTWNWDQPRRSKTWVGCRAGSSIPSLGPHPRDSLSSPGRSAAPGVPMAVPGSRLPAKTASEERGLLPQESRGPSCWYPSGEARPPMLSCRRHPSLGGWLRCCHITPVSRRWELTPFLSLPLGCFRLAGAP